MKSIRYIIGLGVLSLLMGCVERFEANIGSDITEGLVVEGDIISDSTVFFYLSKTLPLTQTDENEDLFDAYTDVDADLEVQGSDGTFWKGRNKGEGKYQVKIGKLDPNVEYHVEIVYQGDTYRSEPQKPLAASGIKSLKFVQPELEGPVSIQLDTQEDDESETKYYLWYYEEDWEVRAKFATVTLYDPWEGVINYPYPPVAQGWCYYATDQLLLGTTESMVDNRITDKTIKSIPYTDHRLSFLYSIRVQQRNLTRKEYEYYQVRAKLNNEMGGLFTPQPSELPTNITCSNSSRKVIGYVGCNMAVASRQLYISTDEVYYRDNETCDQGKDPDGTFQDKYAAGFQICDRTPVGVEWAKIKCVDVRSMQADPNGRPSWWPNDYKYKPE